jgi:hypothetical protein
LRMDLVEVVSGVDAIWLMKWREEEELVGCEEEIGLMSKRWWRCGWLYVEGKDGGDEDLTETRRRRWSEKDGGSMLFNRGWWFLASKVKKAVIMTIWKWRSKRSDEF